MKRYYKISDLYWVTFNVLTEDKRRGYMLLPLFFRLHSYRRPKDLKIITPAWERCETEKQAFPIVYYPSLKIFLGSYKQENIEEISGEEMLTQVMVDNL